MRERLFEPFANYRPEDSDPGKKHKGTGLDLSICRDLIENADRTIRCKNVPGEDATLHITLPHADVA